MGDGLGDVGFPDGAPVGVGFAVGFAVGVGVGFAVGVGGGVYTWCPGDWFVGLTLPGGGKFSTGRPRMIRLMIEVQVRVG